MLDTLSFQPSLDFTDWMRSLHARLTAQTGAWLCVVLRPIPRCGCRPALSCALRAGRARHPLGPPFGRVQLRFFGLYVFGFRCAAAVYPSAGTGFTSGLMVVCCDLEKLASQDWIDRMEE